MATIVNEYYKIVFEHEDFGQFESVRTFRIENKELVISRAKEMKWLLPDWYVHTVKYKAEQTTEECWDEVN